MSRFRPIRVRMGRTLAVAATLALLVSTTVAARQFGAWGPAVAEVGVNSPAADGCPIESPNGRELYIASMRSGTLGGNDIWVAHRSSDGAPWSEPENLGAAINSTANDYCPTPLNGNWLLFVSERPGPRYVQRRARRRRHLPRPLQPRARLEHATAPRLRR